MADKSKRTFFWRVPSVEFDTPSEGLSSFSDVEVLCLGSSSGETVDRGAENAADVLQGWQMLEWHSKFFKKATHEVCLGEVHLALGRSLRCGTVTVSFRRLKYSIDSLLSR